VTPLLFPALLALSLVIGPGLAAAQASEAADAQPPSELCRALAEAGTPLPLEEAEQKLVDDVLRADVGGTRWPDWAAPYRQSPARGTYALLRGLAELTQAVEGDPGLDASPRGAAIETRLRAELTRLQTALEKQTPTREGLDWKQLEHDGGMLAPFAKSSAHDTCGDEQVASDAVFFARPGVPPLVLVAQAMAPSVIPGVPASTGAVLYASAREAMAVRATVGAVQTLFSAERQQALDGAVARLTTISRGWTHYLEHGYSQYPWEAALNSVGTSWSRAPRLQIVLIHPEPAALLDLREAKRSVLEGALLVHGAGLIGYGGDTRSWFLGASATAAVTTSRALGLGGGGTLHLGHTALRARVPHVSLSVLAFATRGKKAPFIGLSVDLWRLLGSGLGTSAIPHGAQPDA